MAPLPLRSDGDWFAIDLDGRIALFEGGDAGPIPEAAAVKEAAAALEALHASSNARRRSQMANKEPAYRAADRPLSEPVFDLPQTIGQEALHEPPTSGYPHLVFGGDGLREGVIDVETQEALVRDPGQSFALIFPSLGPVLYESIHENSLCRGCRALDPPDDPRLRAPELMAQNGLYAYLHPIEGELYTEYDYFRVCSPTVPASHGNVEPLILECASRVQLPLRFDEALSVTADQIRALGPVSKRFRRGPSAQR